MAKMMVENVRVALAKDGTLRLADADEMGPVGQIQRDPESGKWIARTIGEDGKLSRSKTEHARRQEAFEAILRARGIVAEIVSWLQKAIRRGEVDDALYCAAELERRGLGWWLWKRLRVITTEDLGPAWPEGPAVIEALYRTYSDLKRTGGKQPKRRPWRLVVMHAVWLLATAPKSRIADWTSMVMFSEQPRREVPDYALDQHTARGRRMGRRVDHFFEEGTRLKPHAPVADEDGWREQARRAIESGGPLP